MASIEEAKRKNEARLMGLPDVVGVGIGKKGDAAVIQVYVKEVTDAVRENVPATLDGFATEIVKVGEVRRW